MIENFSVCNDYDTWVLKLSGGADSALILYYLQKIRKNQEFWILTGCNKYDEIYFLNLMINGNYKVDSDRMNETLSFVVEE